MNRGVAFYGRLNDGVLRGGVHVPEYLQELIVTAIADGAKHGGDGDLALAIDLYPDHILAATLEIKPGPPFWNQLCKTKLPPAGDILLKGEVNAWRAN